MSHTPGHWMLHRLHVYTNKRDSQQWVASADSPYISATEAEANVRLIAAAPDLLDAARRALIELRQWAPVHAGAEISILKAAIAKATGGQS